MALNALCADKADMPFIGMFGIGIPQIAGTFGLKTIVRHAATGTCYVVVAINSDDLNNWKFDCLETSVHRWAGRRVTYKELLGEYKVASLGEEFVVCVLDEDDKVVWYPFDCCNPFRSPFYAPGDGAIDRPKNGWKKLFESLGIAGDVPVAFSADFVTPPSPVTKSGFVSAKKLMGLKEERLANRNRHAEHQKHTTLENERIEEQRRSRAAVQNKSLCKKTEEPSEITLKMLQSPTGEELRSVIAVAVQNNKDGGLCADELRRAGCTTLEMSNFFAYWMYLWKGWDKERLPRLSKIEKIMPMGANEFALQVSFNFGDMNEQRCWVLHSRLITVRTTLWDKYNARLGKLKKSNWPEWYVVAEEYCTKSLEAMYRQDDGVDDDDVLMGRVPQF
jgi:hypothetical protein